MTAGRQATVAAFDPRTGAGQVVRDDGVLLDFDTAAFTAGGLRHLRPGQRVRLELADDGRVTLVTLATL